ncbi:MAG TPA: ATP-binding protein [Oligoflexus sp.]|uniref:ATP-binding protein n=1 Tax=Oligoflexus sp. TaxID=1971216 RepID=UPI002D459378|nr:ATP-binding protein [Oligoflexus sp.]HYX38683.1 ATP-binding protein [Oligoflexus sp.]
MQRLKHGLVFQLVLLLVWNLFCADESVAIPWEKVFEQCEIQKATQSQPAIDLGNRFAIEYAILDYSELHIPWFEQQIKDIDRKIEPILWMRAAWALALVGRLAPEDIKDAKKIALDGKHYLEYAGLEESQLDSLDTVSANPSVYLKDLNQILEKFRAFNDPESLSFMLGAASLIMVRQRWFDESMPLINEGLKLNEDPRTSSLLVDYRTKTALGASFSVRKMHEEEKTLNFQQIDKLRRCGIRSSRAILAYSRSNLLLQANMPDFAAIDSAIEEALKLSQETQSDIGVGLALYSKSQAFSLRKNFPDAVRTIEEAIAKFKQIRMTNWVAKAYLRSAQIYRDSGRFKESIQAVEIARPMFPLENKDAHGDLDYIHYESLRALNRPEEALRRLESYTKIFKDIAKKREKEEFNKAAAAVGLQLEQERSANLQNELQLKAELLREAEKVKEFTYGLVLALFAVFVVLIYALRQSRIAHRRRSQIEVILNNVDEGLLTINAGCRISVDYSRHLHNLFSQESSFAGMHFTELVERNTNISSENLSVMGQIFQAVLGEDLVAWDLNAGNLPCEFIVNGTAARILHVRWIPVCDEHSRIQRILVCMRDVSKERELESTIGVQEKALRNLPQTLKEIVAEHGPRARGFLAELESWLASDQGRLNGLGRLHTLKGVARAFSYRGLSQEIHDLESRLRTSDAEKIGKEVYLPLRSSLNDYQRFMEIISFTNAAEDKPIWLGSSLEKTIDEFLKRAKQEGLSWQGIQLVDGIQYWNELDISIVESFFIHGLSNALDHGFLRPRRNGQNLNPIRITLRAEEVDQEIRLTLSDNGAGINLNALKKVAEERGLGELDVPSLYALVFQDNVTTAAELSTTSGRGVGLSAVRCSIEGLGGSITIAPVSDTSGTMISARWPINPNKANERAS